MLLSIGALAVILNRTQVQASGLVDILTHSGWLDSIGYYHVSGEVQNSGSEAVHYVEVVATFYNSSNVVVATDFTFSDVDVILPGRKSPFDVLLTDSTQAAKVDHYSLAAMYSTTNAIPKALEILSYSSYTDTYGYMHVVGEIRNNGAANATFVEVIATFYGLTGKVVATDFTFADPHDLQPNQVAPFEVLLIYDERVPLVSTYMLTAQSNEYAIIHERMPDSIPPTTTNDYNGLWHTTDFTITLTAVDDKSGVAQTYFRINGDQARTVNANGQPRITMESTNDTLEYWSVDNEGNEELPHRFQTGIKLDKTAPTGSIVINNGANYTTLETINLTLAAEDSVSGVNKVRYSGDGTWDTEAWEDFSQTKNWNVSSGDGNKTIYFQVEDNAGLISTYLDTIILDTVGPTGTITINQGTLYSNSTSVTLQLAATDGGSGVHTMRFSNDNVTWSTWETYSIFSNWTLEAGDGSKQIFCQFADGIGFTSDVNFSSISLDTVAPAIQDVSQIPSGNVQDNQSVRMTANITDSDSGVQNVRLEYKTNKSTVEVELSMLLNQTNGLYESTIPSQEANTLVKCQISAVDNAGNSFTDDNTGQYYVYAVIPEFPSTVVVAVLLMFLSIALVSLKSSSSTRAVEKSVEPAQQQKTQRVQE
jgi:hypothetical protein